MLLIWLMIELPLMASAFNAASSLANDILRTPSAGTADGLACPIGKFHLQLQGHGLCRHLGILDWIDPAAISLSATSNHHRINLMRCRSCSQISVNVLTEVKDLVLEPKIVGILSFHASKNV
jgi:hypothetical protein